MRPDTVVPTYEELRGRLDVAEQTLSAIQHGEVDALLVTVDGEVRVYTLEGADAFYRALVDQMPEGAAAVAADGTVLYANACFATMLAVPLELFIGTNLPEYVQQPQRAQLAALLQRKDKTSSLDLMFTNSTGAAVPVAVAVSPVDGHAEGARCVVAVDLTQRQAAQDAVRAAEARFRSAFDHAPIGMALLSPGGLVEQVNPSLCTIAGRSAKELTGQILPWLVDDAEDVLGPLFSGQQDEVTVHRRGVQPDGQPTWVALILSLVRGAHGETQHCVAQVQDESERTLHEMRLQHTADHDGLTGLLNRRGFEKVLAEHEALIRRYGSTGAVLLLDIDHFKYINDTRGHQVGDRVLAQLARAMRSRLRDTDVLARLGGDEFAVLLPRAGVPEALVVAEELLGAARAVEVPELTQNRRLTISVGAAAFDDATSAASELLALADVAMYDSKEAGRDQVTAHDAEVPGRSATGSRLTLLADIEQAIQQGSLCLEAQPIVELATGRPVQHELLVRLPAAAGPVQAESWFPVAERYGLAPAIDEWVLTQALKLLAADAFAALSVNVSATSIGRTAWRDHLHSGLQRTGVRADRITFEITETAAISNMAAAVRFTEDLRRLGCRLALDDFGAGFGSFYYLKHLPFDDVKIDGEFVRSSLHDARDQAIISAMVGVAHGMGRRAVAECIEDEATLDLVRAHGVDLVQGFHVGRPAPVALIQPTIAAQSTRYRGSSSLLLDEPDARRQDRPS